MSAAWARKFACLAALGCTAQGWAQSAPPTEKPPVYEDRLIDGGALAPLETETERDYSAAGWPRAWRVEGFSSNFKRGGTSTRENGLAFSGQLDTPDYGAFSVDGTFRADPGRGTFTLWQRGLAFDDGWRANNGLGMLNTPSLGLSRSQYRFYLPTFPIAGISTEWSRGPLRMQASLGEPGLFDGLRLSGFSRLGGHVATAGIETEFAPGWAVGFQLADAGGVRASVDSGDPDATLSGRSGYASLAWQSRNSNIQLNVMDSAINHAQHKNGVWVDGEFSRDRYRYNVGAFHLAPGLFWGYSPVASDLEGFYSRVTYQSLQWLWNAGVEDIKSISGQGIDGTFVTGNLRYQVSRLLGLGGGATFRRSENDAASAFAFIDRQSSLGTTRMQYDYASAEGGQRSHALTVDQAWPTQVGLRLSTSMTFANENSPGVNVHRRGFAINGGADLTNRLSIDGNLRWARDRGDGVSTVGRYANLNANWRVTNRWSLSLSYYDNRSEIQSLFTVDPLLPTQPLAPIPRDRAIFLIVRFEDRAGTPMAPLGGGLGAGAGTIIGSVFLDANDNGRRDADESGAASVTVLLDGKFAVRTDGNGRFEFPFVASGQHALTVVPDNLPLPYSVGGDGRRPVTVYTRERTTIDIAASRMK